MAYCRMDGTCRVYMYASICGGYQFHLQGTARDQNEEGADFTVSTASEALRRLKRLQTQGFGVPQYAIDRLQTDVDEGAD